MNPEQYVAWVDSMAEMKQADPEQFNNEIRKLTPDYYSALIGEGLIPDTNPDN